MASVSLDAVSKSFGRTEILHPLSLDIAHQEFLVLVGPSGCGKSTLLRMIAGLEDVTSGTISIGSRVVNELEPKDRDVAMVFQDYALYPHMSVFDNMAFGLLYRGYAKAEMRRRVLEAARLLDIADCLRRRPRQLSGGQRQRVAMGRAIVRNPEVFLFDEPLSNLDAKLRVQMRTEIKKLHQRVETTVIYVTHDQVEAMTLADRIAVMRAGHVEQVGTPDAIYRRPASTFVAGFIGAPTMNLIPARLEAADGALEVAMEGVRLTVPPECRDRYAASAGREIVFGLRPEHFVWIPDDDPRSGLDVAAQVVEPLGSDTLVFFELCGRELVCRVSPDAVRRTGERLRLYADMTRMHAFDPDSGRAL